MFMSGILDAVYPELPAIRRTRIEMLIVWPMYKAKWGDAQELYLGVFSITITLIESIYQTSKIFWTKGFLEVIRDPIITCPECVSACADLAALLNLI